MQLHGGMSGLTYDLARHWPDSLVESVYTLLLDAWQKAEIPDSMKWKWLVPIPKKENPTVKQLRLIVLIEVLRKVWTSLVIEDIHTTLLKHKVLHPAQHRFQPGHGTDTANL